MLMMINTDVSRRRRQFYKRAITLSSLPPQLIPEVDNETDEDSEQSKLIKSPHHVINTEKHAVIVTGDGTNGHKTNIVVANRNNNKTDSSDLEQAPATPPVPAPVKHKRAMFQARRSITISSDEPLLPLKEKEITGRKSPFSKSPTSPSAILNKFKEKIQQSMFLSSTEWPSAAAILNERRIKANEHAKAQLQQKDLDMEAIHMTELAKKRRQRCRRSDTVGHAPEGDVSVEDPERFRRCRMRSDPVVYSTGTQKDNLPLDDDTLSPEMDLLNRNEARDAFRRRSISEDTYDRLPPTYIKERKQIQASAGGPVINSSLASSQSSTTSGGVICSNEDLHEILNSYKREKSPTPVIAPSRTISADVSKYPRQSYTTTASNQPTYLNQSSYSPYVSQPSYKPSYMSQSSVSSNISVDSVIATPTAGGTADTGANVCDNVSRVYSRLGSNSSASSSVHVYPEVILDSCKGQATVVGSLDHYSGNINSEGRTIIGDNSERRRSRDVNDPSVNEQREDSLGNEDEEEIQQPPEIIFDEYGQTWDVYGAEFDPEILGSAIQRHLDRLMNKTIEERNKQRDFADANVIQPCCSSHINQDIHMNESNSKTLVSWWRFLCLFGTSNTKLEHEQTVC